MNIQSTFAAPFPTGVVIDCRTNPRGSLEVNGLPNGTVPQDFEVLARARPKFYWGRAHQEICLARIEYLLVLLHVEPAGPDHLDGEFVVSHAYAPASNEASLKFETTAPSRKRCHVSVGEWSRGTTTGSSRHESPPRKRNEQ